VCYKCVTNKAVTVGISLSNIAPLTEIIKFSTLQNQCKQVIATHPTIHGHSQKS